MTITDLLLHSFWNHKTAQSLIQIVSVDVDANTVSYITIESLDHAYDTTRAQTIVDFDLLQEDWTISEYDDTRIAEGKAVEIQDPITDIPTP